jgi:hypothetical protein
MVIQKICTLTQLVSLIYRGLGAHLLRYKKLYGAWMEGSKRAGTGREQVPPLHGSTFDGY